MNAKTVLDKDTDIDPGVLAWATNLDEFLATAEGEQRLASMEERYAPSSDTDVPEFWS